MSVLESKIEQYLVEKCKQHNILCYKFISPGHNGVPDRILITPSGIVLFVELKQLNKKPRKLQKHIHQNLKKHNANVLIIDSKDKIDNLISNLKES